MLARVSGIVRHAEREQRQDGRGQQGAENIRDGLMQINHSTRISEAVKAIAFRDEDKRSLREAVFDKLKQKDFDGAYEIVDEIANHSDYRLLAEELRRQVDDYRDATEDERLDQAIADIETLFDACQWAKASLQIESLIRAHPDSEKIKALRQQLVERKEEHKRSCWPPGTTPSSDRRPTAASRSSGSWTCT